jgi:hypothetical protein
VPSCLQNDYSIASATVRLALQRQAVRDRLLHSRHCVGYLVERNRYFGNTCTRNEGIWGAVKTASLSLALRIGISSNSSEMPIFMPLGPFPDVSMEATKLVLPFFGAPRPRLSIPSYPLIAPISEQSPNGSKQEEQNGQQSRSAYGDKRAD